MKYWRKVSSLYGHLPKRNKPLWRMILLLMSPLSVVRALSSRHSLILRQLRVVLLNWS